MQNIKSRIVNLARKSERGVTAVEVMVYIAVLGLVVAGIITLVINSTNASSRFTTTTATQAQVNNTQATITRDLSLAQAIHHAGGEHLQYTVTQENKSYLITTFAFGGLGRETDLPQYIQDILTENPTMSASLPAEAAIMSIREEYGSDAKTITALTKGYDPLAFDHRDLRLFAYYDRDNELIELNSDFELENPDAAINNITRIAFHIAADAPGRASQVQAESSVTPPLDKTNISNNLLTPPTQNVNPGGDFECPIISTVIPRNERAATISWTQALGTTQMYILRQELVNGTWVDRNTYTITNPSTVTFTEPANTLRAGGTYRYSMTFETVVGVVECGEGPPASVIPSPINLRNLNPHAYAGSSNLTGLNTAGTATVLSSDMTVRDINRSATTVQPLANARYTTARGLVNQVSWSGTYGAQQYLVYRNGTVVSVVNANTANSSEAEVNQRYHFTDANRSYGESSNYNVVPRNVGGNTPEDPNTGLGLPTAPNTLHSPPAATTAYTATALDAEGAADRLSANRLNITPNAHVAGYRVKYASSETVAQCSSIPQVDVAAGNTSEGYRYDNGVSIATATGFLSTNSTLSVTQTGVGWGTSTCYRLIPYNDAGSYIYNEGASNQTARVQANQIPERFRISTVNSGSYFANLDYSEDARLNGSFYLDAGGRADCLLWAGSNRQQFGTLAIFCDGNGHKTYGGGPWGTGNWAPMAGIAPTPGAHEMFRNQERHQIYGSQQQIVSRWDVSRGARNGYAMTRTLENSPGGRGSISGYSLTRTLNVPFNTGNETYNGVRFSGEFPGVIMSVQVNSTATNGLVRRAVASNNTSNNKYMFATNAAPSLSTRGGYYNHGQSWGTTQAVNVLSSPSHGFGGTAYVSNYDNKTGAWRLGGPGSYATGSADGVNAEFWTAPFVTSSFTWYRKIIWNSPYGAKESTEFRGAGNVVSPSNSKPAGFWRESYSTYWGNMSGRYMGKQNLDASASDRTYWPNNGENLRSGQSLPTFSNVIGSDTSPVTDTVVCAAMDESHTDFLVHCENGDGIASAPNGLTATRTGNATYRINWATVPAATSYTVEVYNAANTRLSTSTVTTNSANISGISTPGANYRVVVKAVNPVGAGSPGELSFTASPVPGNVTNLAVTTPSPGVARAAWTAASGATSYTVQVHQIAGSNATLVSTQTVTGTQVDFATLTPGQNYRVSVTPVNLAGSGAVATATFTVSVVIVTPATPTGLTHTLNGAVATVSWTATPGAASYRVEILRPDGSLFTESTQAGTSFITPALPANTYTIRVNATNTAGTSAWANRNFTLNPTVPRTVTATNHANQSYRINWTAPVVTGTTYQVRVFKGTSTTAIHTGTTNSLSYVISPTIAPWDGSSYRAEVVAITTSPALTGAAASVTLNTSNVVMPTALTRITGTGIVHGGAIQKAASYTFTGQAFTCPTGYTRKYDVYQGSTLIATGANPAVPVLNMTVGAKSMTYSISCTQGVNVFTTGRISPALAFTVMDKPPTMAAPTVTGMKGSSAILSFPAVANAINYTVITRSENGHELINTVTTTTPTINYPTAKSGNTVIFSVRANYASNVVGDYSPSRSVKVLDTDYTNDGNPDWMTSISIGNQEGRIWMGQGTGNQTGYMQNHTGWGTAATIYTGMDYHRDGFLDVLSHDPASGAVYMYRGTATGAMPNRTTVATLPAGSKILGQGDFSRDGIPDFIVAVGNSASVTLYRGLLSGSFTAVTNAAALPNNGSSTGMIVQPGDFNGDGNLDFIYRYGDTMRIYINSGTGTFPTFYQHGEGWGTIRAFLTPTDVNGDGKDDLITVLSNNTMRTYITGNEGALTPTTVTSTDMATGWNNWNKFVSHDYNKDGRLDLLAVRNTDGTLHYAAGNTSATAANPFTGGLVLRGTGWNEMRFWNNSTSLA